MLPHGMCTCIELILIDGHVFAVKLLPTLVVWPVLTNFVWDTFWTLRACECDNRFNGLLQVLLTKDIMEIALQLEKIYYSSIL